MKQYVLIWVSRPNEPSQPMALFIRKNKPDWQRGKLNLVGGKIEDGETPQQAAVRELKEETDLDGYGMRQVGEITGEGYRIWVFDCTALGDAQSMTDETIEWMPSHMFVRRDDIIPNLRTLVPLLALNVPFQAIDNGDGQLILANR